LRTWNQLSASEVRGIVNGSKSGRHCDGGNLYLEATATKAKDGVTASWLIRFEIDGRERWMGLGSARVVSLSEARAKANE
jgi:hypothetical protein